MIFSDIKNIIDSKNKLVVHCLAGAGRTGSVLLYLLMRDSYLLHSNNKDHVNKHIKELKEDMVHVYFGCNTIMKFIETKLFSYFTLFDDEDLSDNKDFIKCMLAELFEFGENEKGDKKSDEFRISLFRKRLNYIIVFLAKEFNIKEFITYRGRNFNLPLAKSKKSSGRYKSGFESVDAIMDSEFPYLAAEFSRPYKVTIANWNNYNIDDILKNKDKDEDKDQYKLYEEIMTWID